MWDAGFCLGGDKVEGGDSGLGSRVVMRGGGDSSLRRAVACNFERRE